MIVELNIRSHRCGPRWFIRRCSGLVFFFLLSLLLSALLAAGCVPWGESHAARLLRGGDFPSAVTALQAEERGHPQDAEVKRNLGIALYMTGDFNAAVERLTVARTLNAGDAQAAFFLGRACEAAGNLDDALTAYGAYLGLNGRESSVVHARIQALSVQKAARDIREALAQEARLQAQQIPDNTLAVPHFTNVAGNEQLAPLAYGLAAMFITDLSKVERLRVVERARIRALEAELEMAAGIAVDSSHTAPAVSLVDPQTAPRAGRLLGARRLIQGSFVPIAEAQLQLDASLVDVVDSVPRPSGPPVHGPLDRVLHLEKELVYQVLASLGIEPTPAEREEIDRLPTESFLAFLAFSRGLFLEDRGFLDAAANAYGEALQADPGFATAAAREKIVGVSGDDIRTTERSEIEHATKSSADRRDRAIRTGTQSGIGPGPSTNRDDHDDPAITAPGRISAGYGEITIEGELPRGGR